jgi:PAS domain S-box-containing protein
MRLIELLRQDESRRLLERAEPVALTARDIIADSEKPAQHVYFPDSCVLSVLSVMTDGSAVESAVIGREGMAPMSAFYGIASAAEQVIVQVPGRALRLTIEDFRALLHDLPGLGMALHRFAQALFTLTAQASACNRRHSVVQRCARWLLLTHDRVSGDEFPLTHLFLSQMLGVRRSSVTIAAEALRATGAVAYTRGNVQIVNRELLKARACDCYGIIRSTYDRLLEGVATRSPLADVRLSEGSKSVAHAGEPSGRDRLSSRLVTSETLREFSREVMEAQRRNHDLRASLPLAPDRESAMERFQEEISVLLEQLQVAEEELRVQMEALSDAAEVLEQQKIEWQERIDALPDAFIETDRNDSIIEVNRAAEALLGRSRHSLLGKPLVTVVPESDRRGLRDVVTTLRQHGRNAIWRGAVSTSDNVRRRVEAAVSVVAPPRGNDTDGSDGSRGGFRGARWLLRPEVHAERE